MVSRRLLLKSFQRMDYWRCKKHFRIIWYYANN